MITEDKLHFEKQLRKKRCKRINKPSKEDWSRFEIYQIFSVETPRANMNIDEIAKYTHENVPCRTTGHTFKDRYNPESGFGHSINGIKFMYEQAIRGICKRTGKVDHGFEVLNPILKEMINTHEFDKFARGWIYELVLKRFDNSIKTIPLGDIP